MPTTDPFGKGVPTPPPPVQQKPDAPQLNPSPPPPEGPSIFQRAVDYGVQEGKAALIDPTVHLWNDLTVAPAQRRDAQFKAMDAHLRSMHIDPQKASLWDWIRASAGETTLQQLLPGVDPGSGDVPKLLANLLGIPAGAIFSPLHALGIRPAAELISRILPTYDVNTDPLHPRLLSQAESERQWEANFSTALTTVRGADEASPLLHGRLPKPPPPSAEYTAVRAAKRLLGKRPGQAAFDVTEARKAAEEHRRLTGEEPVPLDVMKGRAVRNVRAAGVKSEEGGEALSEHRQGVRAGIAAVAARRARQLTQFTESVKQRVASLRITRSNLARTKYREPYAVQIELDGKSPDGLDGKRLITILDDQSGFNAMKEARRTARTRSLDDPEAGRQDKEIGELQNYFVRRAEYERELAAWKASDGGSFPQPLTEAQKNFLANPNLSEAQKAQVRAQLGYKEIPPPVEPTVPNVSAGAIDRIRIQLERSGSDLMKKGRTYARGQGWVERAEALDRFLDDVPHLKEARAEYRSYSERIAQLEFDEHLSTMDPRDFKQMLEGMPDDQKAELTHNLIERLAKGLGASARGEQATSDVLATSPDFRENLRLLVGNEKAEEFIQASRLLQSGLKKATLADPEVGSRTALVESDLAKTGQHVAMAALRGSWHSAIHGVAGFLVRNMTGMSEAEAQQIAEWAVKRGNIEDTLKMITEAAGKPTPARARALSKMPRRIQTIVIAHGLSQGAPAAQQPADDQTPGAAPAETPQSGPIDTGDPHDPFNPGYKGPKGAHPAQAEPQGDAGQLTGLQGDDLKAAMDVMGVESGGAPGKLDPAAFNPAGGGEGARGIAQWRGDRQEGEGGTLNAQLAHVGEELRGKYAAVIPAMKAAPTLIDKYDVWLTQYEGLERGGPDYMTDLTRLVGADKAREYAMAHGGRAVVRRAGQSGRGDRGGGIAGGSDPFGAAFAGSIAPDAGVELSVQ